MYEYRTASFFVNGRSHGHPLDEVDKFINTIQLEGWEFVQLTQSALTTGISVILLFRKLAN
jgi:hypothetical protein